MSAPVLFAGAASVLAETRPTGAMIDVAAAIDAHGAAAVLDALYRVAIEAHRHARESRATAETIENLEGVEGHLSMAIDSLSHERVSR